jgi:hypothetical protein
MGVGGIVSQIQILAELLEKLPRTVVVVEVDLWRAFCRHYLEAGEVRIW